jgi:integrase
MDMPISSTALDTCIKEFISHKRTLGRKFKNEEYILLAFRRFLQNDDADDLDQVVFDRWCHQLSSLNANTRLSRQLVLRNLCLYRQRSEPDCFVPNSLYFSRPQPARNPVMIEPEQVAKILDKTNALAPSGNSPLRGPVLRMAIVLLYTAGLRRGELVHLRLDDVDSRKGVVRICESKFHKSRIVPLSATARQELRKYLRAREQQGCPQRASSALLCNFRNGWRPYTGAGLRHGIVRLIEEVGVCDAYGRRPCVHDFRHNFAVQALIRLYRRNADVQSGLPHLALYMGHVSIASTAYYLHFIPTLAALASDRFEHYCGDVLKGGRNES